MQGGSVEEIIVLVLVTGIPHRLLNRRVEVKYFVFIHRFEQ